MPIPTKYLLSREVRKRLISLIGHIRLNIITENIGRQKRKRVYALLFKKTHTPTIICKSEKLLLL